MTTEGEGMVDKCDHCTALAAERDAAAKEAAVLREAWRKMQYEKSYLRHEDFVRECVWCRRAFVEEGHAPTCDFSVLNDPSPAVAALERRLAPMPCGHPGACVVSTDEGTNYCGWCEEVMRLREENADRLSQTMHEMAQKRARAEALAELVPEAGMLIELAAWAWAWTDEKKWQSDELEALVQQTRALAARIEEARGQEDGDG